MTDVETKTASETAELESTPASAPVVPKAKKRAPENYPWTPRDYSAVLVGSGASKLASSAVAPLVAAARGYASINVENHEDFAKTRIGDRRSKAGRQFRDLFLDGGDALIMPWFSLDQMRASADEVAAGPSTTLQYRPSNPRKNEAGKLVKYEFVSGGGTVLDNHPAVPKEWVSSAPRTLIAEGLLKGDSALTAQLRTWYSDEELSITEADALDRNHALRRLAALVMGIPQSERTAIISIGGVGNWRNNQEWFQVNVKQKDVVVAFDGDVETNYNVWSMAVDMYQYLIDVKKGEPSLLSLASNSAAAIALADDPHMGLDDFFRSHGTWADLDSMIKIDLPARPERPDHANIGDWRVSPDGLTTQEYVEVPSEGMDKGQGRWVTRVGYGGRIHSVEVHRPATDEETEGQPFGAGLESGMYPSHCAIEIAWQDESGAVQRHNITGPTTMLHYSPADWHRQGAMIPDPVLRHDEWPPAKGVDWLKAAKKNRKDETEDRTVWATMGWVPVPGMESQAFIVGRQVIAATPEAASATRPGVVGNALTNAERFGLHDVYTGPNLTDPTGEHNLVDDLRTLLDVYWHETPWLDPKVSATTLAIALRPAIPLPTSVAAYFVGAPQKGKSWTARQCMSFWQGRRGVWRDTLPGSANDTFATTESAVSKTPIWVVDDIAPSPDRKTAEMQEAKIGELIRAVHNKLGKRRMNRDMTERNTPAPMALTIFTAENESSVQSIKERVVTVEFKGLRGDKMIRADELANKSTVASRVTAAAIRMYINAGEKHGWTKVVNTLRIEREEAIEAAREVLTGLGIAPGDQSRPAEIAADLSMGLVALQELLIAVGLDEESDLIGWSEPNQWMQLITEQIGLSHLNKAEVSPGKVLIDCIRGLLATGAGHIANIDNPSAPPIEGENSATANMLMGWSQNAMGEMQPRGSTIGYLTRIGDKGATSDPEDVIFILADDAFALAQNKYPKRIQYGASPSTSWRNVWDLGLTHSRYPDGANRETTRQFRIRGTATRMRGVPLSMQVLFSGTDDDGEI